MSSNKELMQRRSQAIPRGVGKRFSLISPTGENCRHYWDVEGREYLDFAGGIAVLNTGHLHPKVVQCVGGSAVDANCRTPASRCWPTSRIWSCARL